MDLRTHSEEPTTRASLDWAAAAFESEWRAGQRPAIQSYLGQLPGSERTEGLLRLVEVEIRCRRDRHERPDLREYQSRFPEIADELQRSFGGGRESDDFTFDSTFVTPARAAPDALPESPAPPAQTLGRYQLIELIGQGGFGQVWRAFDPALNRIVAVKTLRPDRFSTDDAVQRFLDEGRKLAQLDHDGIVPVFDAGFSKGQCFLVSQFIDGGTLAQAAGSGEPQTPENAADTVEQLARAAHHAHLRGIVHRDIKPSNVLIKADGQVCLADFGLAITEEEQLSERGVTVGTMSYMSPEQARGEAHLLDARTDIYSLGVVLYRLLTGRLPFSGTEREQVAEQILHRQPRPPRTIVDSVSPELERICLKCLSKSPAERYTTARDLADDLHAAVHHPSFLARRRIPALILTAVLALGAGLFAISPWQGRPGTEEIRVKEIVWNGRNDACDYEWLPGRTLRVVACTRGLLGLGVAEGDRESALTVGIEQYLGDPFADVTGLFFGFREYYADSSGGVWQYQLLRLVRLFDGRYLIRRDLQITNELRPFDLTTFTLAEVEVHDVSPTQNELGFTTHDGRLTSVTWNGLELPELIAVPEEIPVVNLCDGDYGVYADNTGVLFNIRGSTREP